MVRKKSIPGILGKVIKNREESRYAKMMYAAVFLLAILSVRLFYMQIVEGSYYKAEADGNRIRTLPVQAARGVMYDRNGIMLAGSRPTYTVVIPVDRKQEKLPEAELQAVAALLGMEPEDIQKKQEEYKVAFGSIPLAHDVGLDVVSRIAEKKADFPDIEVESQPLRIYPLKNAGAQVVGYVGEAGPDERNAEGQPYTSSTLIGRTGLEYQYNSYLEGKNGSRHVEVDATGQPVRYFSGEPVVSGYNVRLTLDARLQEVAERAIEEQVANLRASKINPTGASVVAVDPNSGAILAMVSWPSFDPNQFSRGITAGEWNAILNNPNHPLENRPITSMYPPGSTFKVITSAAGLEAMVLDPQEAIFDSGKHWLIDKRNAQGEAFGWINFEQAMEKSDNVYFYEIGRRLGIDRIAAMARAFGLGSRTGIDLAGESEGNVASEEYKKKVFGEDWYLGETFDAAIGQSYTLTTPLQMAMVYAAIANGGFRYQPYLVSRVDNLDGTPNKIFSPVKTGTLPVSQANLAIIRQALRSVMGKEGTGGFLFEHYPIPLAGKSGTAETNGLDNGWFVAYAPFDKPEIVVLVMFEHSGFGSDSAAPVTKKILDAYFHLGEFSPSAQSGKQPKAEGDKGGQGQ